MSDPIPNHAPAARPLVPDPASFRDRHVHGEKLDPNEFTKLLTTVATNAWKLRGRIMVDPKGDEIREELKKDDIKKLVRHVDSIFEALTAFEVEVRDRTGETYDYGLPDKIVSSSPQPGLSKELIIETLRPSIYWRSMPIQAAEVVIAVPVEQKAEEK
jgi:hypothetical protein